VDRTPDRGDVIAASPPTARSPSGGGLGAEGGMPEVPEMDPRMDAALGSVRIASRVLRTVVEEAALRVSGVARMAHIASVAQLGSRWPRLLGRALPHHGVGLTVRDDGVAVDLYLIVEPTANMVQVGSAVQESVSAAIEHILGMRARAINVYVQDVA